MKLMWVGIFASMVWPSIIACSSDSDSSQGSDTDSEMDMDTDVDSDGDADGDLNRDTDSNLDMDVDKDSELVDTGLAVDTATAIDTGAVEDTDSDTDTSTDLTCPDDDDFEENDWMEETYPVYPPVYLDAMACSWDGDFYRFHADTGQTIEIHVSFIDALGDIDVILYGPLGAQIATAESVTDNEELSHRAEESGEYTIRIHGWKDE